MTPKERARIVAAGKAAAADRKADRYARRIRAREEAQQRVSAAAERAAREREVFAIRRKCGTMDGLTFRDSRVGELDLAELAQVETAFQHDYGERCRREDSGVRALRLLASAVTIARIRP